MSAAGLLAPAPAPAGAPPAPEYYPEEDEELESAEDDERSCRGRESDEGPSSRQLGSPGRGGAAAGRDTEDASETDLAKHDEEDYVEMKEQMYQDKLASLKRQLQQLQEGTLQEYQKRMKKLDQQYKERIRNAELFLQLETEQVERNYIKEKKAAVKEFEDKKVELKENLIAELEEKKKMIENEKLTMELTGDSMEVKPIMTRKLRRRPNDPLNYLLTDEQIMEDLRTLNKLKSPKRPASPSSPEHLPTTPAESPAQRFEARIEDGKLYYDKRCSPGLWLRDQLNYFLLLPLWSHSSCFFPLWQLLLTHLCFGPGFLTFILGLVPELVEESEDVPALQAKRIDERGRVWSFLRLFSQLTQGKVRLGICVSSQAKSVQGISEAYCSLAVGFAISQQSTCAWPYGPLYKAHIWVRKTSDSTKMRIYLGQLQRGLFVIRRSSLLPQKLGAEVLAEGESFSGLSLLGETNVLCYVCVCHPFHCLKDRKIRMGDNVHCSKRGRGRESVSYS
ncbi:SUDS3 [Cervus elaphus hippelaphus]|uniref:SUDS3 n=1 Tax=Cervus elaphus hippelaphus TaxID=46360 RepID=A0A212DA99_CEREH|nr:SUDS3 [Cervus elaphus hippelaphus]